MKNQTRNIVMCFRTDNGLELCSIKMKALQDNISFAILTSERNS